MLVELYSEHHECIIGHCFMDAIPRVGQHLLLEGDEVATKRDHQEITGFCEDWEVTDITWFARGHPGVGITEFEGQLVSVILTIRTPHDFGEDNQDDFPFWRMISNEAADASTS